MGELANISFQKNSSVKSVCLRGAYHLCNMRVMLEMRMAADGTAGRIEARSSRQRSPAWMVGHSNRGQAIRRNHRRSDVQGWRRSSGEQAAVPVRCRAWTLPQMNSPGVLMPIRRSSSRPRNHLILLGKQSVIRVLLQLGQ